MNEKIYPSLRADSSDYSADLRLNETNSYNISIQITNDIKHF